MSISTPNPFGTSRSSDEVTSGKLTDLPAEQAVQKATVAQVKEKAMKDKVDVSIFGESASTGTVRGLKEGSPELNLAAKKTFLAVITAHLKASLKEIGEAVKQDAKTIHAKLGELKVGTGTLNNAAQANFNKIKEFLNPQVDTKQAEFITEQLASGADNKPAIIKEIHQAVTSGAKSLKAGESKEIVSKNFPDKTLVVMKNEDNSVSAFVKGKLLGSGAGGDAYVVKGENGETVMKFARKMYEGADEVDEDLAKQSIKEMKNEASNLALLNKNGSKEGVQASVSLTSLKNKAGDTETVTHGMKYEGTLGSMALAGRAAALVGESPSELHKLSEKQVEEKVDKFISDLGNKLSTKQNDINKMPKGEARNKAQTALSKKYQVVMNDVRNTVRYLAPTKAESEAFGQAQIKLQNALKNGTSLDIKNEVQGAFKGVMTSIVSLAREEAPISTAQRMALGANVVIGMNHIHETGIIHGDIKPMNFFFGKEGAVIADFGGSQARGSMEEKLTTTPGYHRDNDNSAYVDAIRNGAPEEAFRAGVSIDQYALGVSLYEMISGGTNSNLAHLSQDLILSLQEGGLSLEQATTAATIIGRMTTPLSGNPVSTADLNQLATLLKQQ